MAPTRLVVVGPALIGLSGLALVAGGLTPVRLDASGALEVPALAQAFGVTFFASTALGLLARALRMARDHGWHGVAPWAATAGFLGLASLPVLVSARVPRIASPG